MGILNDFSLEGKVALVTGASYGIGFAIATAYAQACLLYTSFTLIIVNVPITVPNPNSYGCFYFMVLF